jgi:hypothetical protein
LVILTATTVGYGDLRPVKRNSKIVAIVAAFFGLTLTGIVIAVAVHRLPPWLWVTPIVELRLSSEPTTSVISAA